MCLIVLAWQVRASGPLVVAANRDEFHARPAAPAAFWEDAPDILAGRDLEAGGTWMGVSRGRRFAAVTNYRGGHDPNAAESRGALVSRFLAGTQSAAGYAAEVSANGSRYSGFNLLLCDGGEFWWTSNRTPAPRRLDPGHYALGNNLLDTPEVGAIRQRFSQGGESVETLFEVMAQARIRAPIYGTRCSTVLRIATDGGLDYAERPFDEQGAEGTTVRYSIRRMS